jgi:hypothetical protein
LAADERRTTGSNQYDDLMLYFRQHSTLAQSAHAAGPIWWHPPSMGDDVLFRRGAVALGMLPVVLTTLAGLR